MAAKTVGLTDEVIKARKEAAEKAKKAEKSAKEPAKKQDKAEE